MQVDIKYSPGYALAVCSLAPGEQIKAESGAMVSMSSNIQIETQTGGVMKGLKRALLGGENFFMNTFTAINAPGEVSLSPTLPGDIKQLPLNGAIIVQGTSYLASSPGIQIDTQFKGFKGLFSGEGLFMLKAEGQGNLLISCFGAMHEVEIDGDYIVDTGHVVAFEPGLDYSVTRVGGWVATLFSGEGLISRFRGRGRLILQTRNPQSFGSQIGGQMPSRN
jgi:uncharacterized protein (TIGR00266 family)